MMVFLGWVKNHSRRAWQRASTIALIIPILISMPRRTPQKQQQGSGWRVDGAQQQQLRHAPQFLNLPESFYVHSL
jgi:hypothetical protein